MILKSLIQLVDDSTKMQLVKVTLLSDEDQDGVERVQEYGMTSNPPIGSEAVVVQCAGASDNLVCIKVDSATYRILGLLPGEVCLYSQFGQTIKFDLLGETIFNGGALGVAREGHAVTADATTDADWVAWTAFVTASLSSLGYAYPDPPPVTLTGKISEGSSKVKIDA
jgi:phage baseplate assembly protein V